MNFNEQNSRSIITGEFRKDREGSTIFTLI